MRNKLFFLFMALLLVLPGMPVYFVNGAADDMSIDYSVSDSSITAGEVFNLSITLDRSDPDITFTSITYVADTNFTLIDTDSSPDIFNEPAVYTMRYVSGSNSIAFKIAYKKSGSAQTLTKVVNITEVVEDSDGSSSGSSNREPKLDVENSLLPAVKAGESIKIPLTITNNSRNAAKNISVKLSLEDTDQNPFEADNLNLTQTISTLNSQKSDDVIFNLKISPYAEEKTYSLKVNLKYSDRSNNSYTSSDSIYIKVKNSSTEPALVLQNVKCEPQAVQAGDKASISFTLTNTGDLSAKGIKVALDGLKREEFTMLEGSDTIYIQEIEGKKSVSLKYTLDTSDAMESGNYGLAVKLDYKDARNNKYSDEHKIFINIKGGAKSSNVVIKNVTVNPQEVKANESFTLAFDIQNDGKVRAENIKAAIKGDEGILSKSPDIKIIDSLEPGQSQRAEFMLFAGDQMKTKSYNIQLSLEYEDSAKDNTKYTVNQYAGVYVNGANSKLTPKIIIDNYRFEPMMVRAGEEFSLDMSFLNTSSSRTVRNIKVFLTGIDSDKEGKIVFTPVNSSNTFFIDSIAPKGVSRKSLIMYTIPDAQAMTYTITANFEYQDEEGTEYKATELIGIPVIQQSKLDAGEISIPPEVYVGQPVPINVQYFNKGKTKLGNLIIKVEGDFDVETRQSYIGNFESGSSDYFETNITPTKAGSVNGRFIFTYDDPSGEPQEFTRDFSIKAMDMPPVDPNAQMPPEGLDAKKSLMDRTIKNKFFWMGLAAAALGGAIGIRLLRLKRKKGLELDE